MRKVHDPGMLSSFFKKCAVLILLSAAIMSAAPYTELVPGFNCKTSNAMVRRITVPTASSLDYAAYNANPVLYEPQKFKPGKPGKPVYVSQITFAGLLANTVSSIKQTPLTEGELENPLAWRPLTKRLWEIVKDQGFDEITAGINGYKWSDPSISASYQEIVTAYIHSDGSKKQLWVKIEFSSWVKFIKDATDEDGDGFREIYGRLVLDKIPAGKMDNVYEWIEKDYTKKVLTHDQIIDWITDLASYWYPAKNTDVLENDSVWPGEETEKSMVRTMRGTRIKNPVAIVRGRPFGKPIYNVYVVDGPKNSSEKKCSIVSSSTEKKIDTSVSVYTTGLRDLLNKEVEIYGDYPKWEQTLAPFMRAQTAFLDSLPQSQMGYEGKDGWLFFRKDLEYGTAGDLDDQKYEKNPVAHIVELKKYLERHNVSLLFVPVPNKTEVYFEKLPFESPSDPLTIVNPFSRKLLRELQDSGVEVIDLLSAFLKAKSEDGDGTEPIYQKQDTHWTPRGLQIASSIIADRIRSYGWYKEFAGDKSAFTYHDTAIYRQGDIVERLPETVRAGYPPAKLNARQVLEPDGSLFKSSKDAPLVLIGDSFTGVFESVDCKSAGVGANIALETGISLDIITSWGGGPPVRERFVRNRKDVLDQKRLVIYMMVARDLYNYEQPWTPLQ